MFGFKRLIPREFRRWDWILVGIHDYDNPKKWPMHPSMRVWHPRSHRHSGWSTLTFTADFTLFFVLQQSQKGQDCQKREKEKGQGIDSVKLLFLQ